MAWITWKADQLLMLQARQMCNLECIWKSSNCLLKKNKRSPTAPSPTPKNPSTFKSTQKNWKKKKMHLLPFPFKIRLLYLARVCQSFANLTAKSVLTRRFFWKGCCNSVQTCRVLRCPVISTSQEPGWGNCWGSPIPHCAYLWPAGQSKSKGKKRCNILFFRKKLFLEQRQLFWRELDATTHQNRICRCELHLTWGLGVSFICEVGQKRSHTASKGIDLPSWFLVFFWPAAPRGRIFWKEPLTAHTYLPSSPFPPHLHGESRPCCRWNP